MIQLTMPKIPKYDAPADEQNAYEKAFDDQHKIIQELFKTKPSNEEETLNLMKNLQEVVIFTNQVGEEISRITKSIPEPSSPRLQSQTLSIIHIKVLDLKQEAIGYISKLSSQDKRTCCTLV